MKYLLTEKNYVSLAFDYNKSIVLRILESISVTNLVTACDKNTVAKISMILGSKLPIHTILYFRLQPTVDSIIHIDKNSKDPKVFQAMFALNLPLINCDNVLMNWYSKNSTDVDTSEFIGPNGSTTPSISKDKVTCIDQTYYTGPHIVKINDWHSVENQSTTDVAQFISLRFIEPLDQVISSFDQRFKML